MKPKNPEIDQHIDPNLLLDNCAFVTDKQPVRHNFSKEEIISLKNELFEEAKHKDIREKAMALFKESINKHDISTVIDTLKIITKQPLGDRGLKELKRSFSDTLKKINRGYEDRQMKLFAFPYYEIKTMAFYNEKGHYVYDRPMTDGENQLTISQIKKIS